MKKNIIYLLLLLAFICSSCKSDSQKKAETSATEFLSALKEQDVIKMKQLYPNVDNIEIFYASDTSYINESIDLSDNGVQINAISQYINERGKVETRKIILLLYPSENNDRVYEIADSYGLCSIESYPHFKFAVHTGCISSKKILTDQQAIQQLRMAKEILFLYTKNMYIDLENNVKIINSVIHSRDKYGANGTAYVENQSEFTLPDLKYIIIYYDQDNNEIFSDKGWITEKSFEPGDIISFDFTTKYAPGAVNAKFGIDFDLELILDFVKEDDIYTGEEYQKYIDESSISL